jgi:hypothetical protein
MRGKIQADPRPDLTSNDYLSSGARAGAVSGLLAGALYGAFILTPQLFLGGGGRLASLLDLGVVVIGLLMAFVAGLVGVALGGLIGPLLAIITYRFKLVRWAGPIGTILGATILAMLSAQSGQVGFVLGFIFGGLSGQVGARRFVRRLERG